MATRFDTSPPEKVSEVTNVEYTWSHLRAPCLRLYTQ